MINRLRDILFGPKADDDVQGTWVVFTEDEMQEVETLLSDVQADNTQLRAELKRALDALRAAPGHDEIWPGITGAEHFIELALEWYDNERRAALGEVE